MKKIIQPLRSVRAFILTLLLVVVTLAQAEAAIKRFERVADDVYRSGRPTLEQITELKKQGFKTIINLEKKMEFVEPERQKAESLGIKFVSVPLDWDQAPTDKQADLILKTLRDRNQQPALVHCFHGQDRTGLMVALYRVEVQGTPPEEAYQEMIDKGFHVRFKDMVAFFKKRTGMN